MKIVLAILFLFAVTMPCFVSSASAQQQPASTVKKSAKQKTNQGSAPIAAKKPPCSPNPERACY